MSKIVDARGLACPTPVIHTKRALENTDNIVVIVDNETARENVGRLAQRMGCRFETEKREDGIYLRIQKQGGLSDEHQMQTDIQCDVDKAPKNGPVVLTIQQDRMGRGNDELGTVLIRSFIHTLGEISPVPEIIIFFNTGVKLTVKGSEVIEDLKSLEDRGIKILVCGTCLNFFGLTAELEAGMISNMYDIAEIMLSAGKLVAV